MRLISLKSSFKPDEPGIKPHGQRRRPLLALLFGGTKPFHPVAKACGFYSGSLRTAVYLLITIMVLPASHPHLRAQQVTTQATPLSDAQDTSSSLPDERLPDEPGAARYPETAQNPRATQYPVAEVLPATEDTTDVKTEEDTLSRSGSVVTLDGDVMLTYRDRIVKADHIEFDQASGELTATGHLHVSGGANHEDLTASHGTMNLKQQTATFYDVTGSVGLKSAGHTLTYSSSNPFLFTGRMVVRTGPQSYEIYDGTLTTCQLPHPDWMLYAGKFAVDSEKAKAQNSTFRLMNIPVLFLPYVTHPTDSEQRQTGFMIPVPGYSSTKGFTLGEEFYWAINRSTDLTVGAQYYSLRGWEQSATFRYRGLGNDFAKARYTGLLDRGIFTSGVYLNQGGEDATVSGRHDFTSQTRVVGDVEYLSSYAYREAFAENFSVAVSSDILSIVYGVHQWDGYSASARVDRYQGLKQAGVAATPTTPAIPEEQVKIFHAPSLDFTSTEHEIGRTGLLWSIDASHAGLSRVQPDFSTGGLTQRFDLHPELSYRLGFDGWHMLASIGARETAYSRSRQVPYAPIGVPVELPNPLNRSDVEVEADLRAPVVERTFDSPRVEKLFGGNDVKHTIEPELTYRYVTGVNNFLSVLRFDDADIVSNTNELEYGVTQRLFLRPTKARPCKERPTTTAQTQYWDDDSGKVQTRGQGGSEKDALPNCGSHPLLSWRLTQKHFFNENFGGAVINGRRNIFDTTLNFSGIAFLTEPRAISPLVSRLRLRTSSHMDVEWDFDLDTGAKKFTSNNVFVDVHQNNVFAGLSYARLNAPGRFYTEGVTSAVSDFNQLRLLLGYGSPTKPGLGVAGNVGLDLNANNTGLVQYGAVQGSYNWDCCGFSVEVRKYELGSVRNETTERFNFTLLNIGTAGNLRRAASLF
ncbi:LPS assembly protein LptD [Tunturiibacter empetritectus]|uniref:LPS-assembly protein n=2 Tax=Tunturiibacter TaxID=3154218 RepID=A0A852VLQ0_9BACT|nr:LPS-assembly protein [Edaphobacter lichenicola]